ncbi:MAG: IclR family transcriptional regulator [Galactobacter sp.]
MSITPRAGGTIGKGLELLRMLGEFPHGATAAEIAAASDHPFSTAYRLLGTLVESGFVELDPATKRYSLGLAVFELGQRVAQARGFAGVVQPAMEQLTTATQETSLLAVLDGSETVTVHTVDGPGYRTTTDPGDRGPLHTSAIGKMLLAGLPPATREATIAELVLQPRTPHSVTTLDTLRQQIDTAAAAGWVYQDQEHDLGMNALAAPVRRADGRVIAALALAAPVIRADRDALMAHLPQLLETATKLGLLLP